MGIFGIRLIIKKVISFFSVVLLLEILRAKALKIIKTVSIHKFYFK